MSLCLYSFRKMVWFKLALQLSKIQLAHLRKMSMGFKMVVLTPKLDMGILPPHQYFSKEIFQKYPLPMKNSLMVKKIGMCQRRIWVKHFQVLTPSLIFRTHSALRSLHLWYVSTSLQCFSPIFEIIPPSICFLIVAYPKYVWKPRLKNLFLGNSMQYPWNLEITCFHFITEK